MRAEGVHAWGGIETNSGLTAAPIANCGGTLGNFAQARQRNRPREATIADDLRHFLARRLLVELK